MPREAVSIAVVASSLAGDPRAAAARARAAGFDGVQFDAYSGALDIPTLSGSGRREFRHVLSGHDLQLVGLRWDAGPRGFRPGTDVEQALSHLDAAMEAAAGLMSPLVCVDLGPLPEPAAEPKPNTQVTAEQAGLLILPTRTSTPEPAPAPSPPPDPQFVSQVDAVLDDMGRRADRYSVMLALRSDLASFAALERALRKANCPWFGVDLDPVAILRDDWEEDEAFSRFGSLIRHVRGRDATKGAERRTKPAALGRGDTDWQQLLSNLDAAHYNGWVTVDPVELPDRAAAASQAREHLKQAAGR